MEGNNWRAAQAPAPAPAAADAAAPTPVDPTGAVDSGNWRAQLPPESRQRIVNKIMETLRRHIPYHESDGINELKKIAMKFEEKIYAVATTQSDYLRRISLKMLSMETKSTNNMANSHPSNNTNNNQNPQLPGTHTVMQNQVNSQGQTLSVPVVTNQSQPRQQLLSQNIQNNMTSTGLQNSANSVPSLSTTSNLTQPGVANVVNQNSGLQNIQAIPNVSQSSVGNSMAQGMGSNLVANSQRQMQGRQQQVIPQHQQQQQPSQNPLLYQQHLHNQMMKHQSMQSHIQQQQERQQHQNLLQQNQIQSSQQAVMQPSLQQSQQSSVQQPTQSLLQQRSQSVLRQQQNQQAPMLHQHGSHLQQSMLQNQQQQQQQQQMIGQQQSVANIQQSQLLGQQNNLLDMQHQQPRAMSQQNNYSNIHQQQLINQQNNIQNIHQQQLGNQGNVVGLQQPQVAGNQSSSSGLTSNQHAIQMLQHSKVPVQQQMLSNSTMLPTHGLHSQPQQSQQQMMSQSQAQPGSLQPPMGLQHQTNSLQQEMQQRIQASSPLLQQQNVIDQQKQLLQQQQRATPEAPSTSLDSTAQTGNVNGSDWQEEAFQKIKSMREMYLADLTDFYLKISGKLAQYESVPQQPSNDQTNKFKSLKNIVEKLIQILRINNKNEVQLQYKEKLGAIEKQIQYYIHSNRPRRPTSSMQQPLQPHMQPQNNQTHDNSVNPQMQYVNAQGSMAAMQQNSLTAGQHGPLSSVSAVTGSPQNMINTLQHGTGMDSLSSLQAVANGSLQQNPVNGPQQMNISSLSSQSGAATVQSNLSALQPNSNMLQHQHLKPHEQQMLHNPQIRHQFHQQQLKQQLMQQRHMKQPQAPLTAHQMQQFHQVADSNDMKMRQQLGIRSGVLQQNQRMASQHPHHKSSISSPQLQQALSPQLSQHPSPQIDQQNVLSSTSKAGTPLQSSGSPFIIPSPSTPIAPSPIPGESEKPSAGISSHPTTGNIGHQQVPGASVPGQSLAIGTPGISASPLLAELNNLDGSHANTSTISGKSSVEQPIERLIKVASRMSREALSSSVSDISSVVSMIDRIAGSAPGNGSRAAVGEDLVSMTRCRMQARNFLTQDGPIGTKKMKRYTTSNVVSSGGSVNDSFRWLNGSETSDSESTATSSAKKSRIEVNHALIEEIKDINRHLIDTVVEISNGNVDPNTQTAAMASNEGTTIKCSFSAVALSPNLKSLFASAELSPIQPLRLLVPASYPNCSPILLDKFPVEISKGHEDLSIKAKSRFFASLRTLSQPMSLKEIVRTWDVCARAVISEYGQQSGGGSFSSKYGSWENCL